MNAHLAVERLLEYAGRQFGGNGWVGAMLQAMKSLADSRCASG